MSEPSLPASPAPLGDTGPAHAIAQADAVQPADCDDTVPATALGCATDASAHGDAAQSIAGGAAAGRIQFRRVKVCDADLDPSGPTDTGHGLDAEAVAVADIDDRAGEGATGPGLGWHGTAIGNAGAGVGQDGSGEGQGTEKGEGSDHGSLLEPTEGGASNGFAAVAQRIEAVARALEVECLRLDVEADWEVKLAQAQHLDRVRALWLAEPRVRRERQRLNPGKRALDFIAAAVKFVRKAVKGKAADLVQQSQWILGVPGDEQKQGRQQTFGGEQSAGLFDVGIGQGVHALGNLTAVLRDQATLGRHGFLDLKGEVDVHLNLSCVWKLGRDAESRGRETGPAAERAVPFGGDGRQFTPVKLRWSFVDPIIDDVKPQELRP